MYEVLNVRLVPEEAVSKHLLKAVKTIKLNSKKLPKVVVNRLLVNQCLSFLGNSYKNDPYVTQEYGSHAFDEHVMPSTVGFVDVANITGGLTFKDKMDYFDFINKSELFKSKVSKLFHYEYTDDVNDYIYGRPIIAYNGGYYKSMFDIAESIGKRAKYKVFYTNANINVTKSPNAVRQILAEGIISAYKNQLKEDGITPVRFVDRVKTLLESQELKGGTYIISPTTAYNLDSTQFLESLKVTFNPDLYAVVPSRITIANKEYVLDIKRLPNKLKFYKITSSLNWGIPRNAILREITKNYGKIFDHSHKIPGLIVIPSLYSRYLNNREKMILASLARFVTLPRFYPTGKLLVDMIHNIDPGLKPKLLELLAIVRLFVLHQNGYYNFLYTDYYRDEAISFVVGGKRVDIGDSLYIYNDIPAGKYIKYIENISNDEITSNKRFFKNLYKMDLPITSKERIKEVGDKLVIPYVNKDYNRLLLGYREIANKYKFMVRNKQDNRLYVVTGISKKGTQDYAYLLLLNDLNKCVVKQHVSPDSLKLAVNF